MHPSNASVTPTQRIVVGITGASGALYAQRLIQLLAASGFGVHLVASPMGLRLLHDELGMEGLDLDALTGSGLGTDPPPTDPNHPPQRGNGVLIPHAYRDLAAPIASGSFQHRGMVIIPCSSNSLAAVAHGSSQNLLHRAAAVTLKERRSLVLVHRETPLSLTDIRNMQLATEAGAILCPANPGFYLLPRTISDLVDFVVGRVLDLLQITHQLDIRWPPPETPPETPSKSPPAIPPQKHPPPMPTTPDPPP